MKLKQLICDKYIKATSIGSPLICNLHVMLVHPNASPDALCSHIYFFRLISKARIWYPPEIKTLLNMNAAFYKQRISCNNDTSTGDNSTVSISVCATLL